MIDELFFIGKPLLFKQGIYIYPPTVSDVICNPHFAQFCRLLTLSQEEIEDEFLAAKKKVETYPTPIEFLLNNSYHNKQYEQLCKEAFLFFLHKEVTFLYLQKVIIIGDVQENLKNAQTIDDLIVIKEEEFFDFQNAIRKAIGKKEAERPNPNEDPRIAEMKRKSRRRERLKEKQASNKGEAITLYTTLVSICCMGLGISPLNIGEMSYVAMQAILRKYQEKEKYQLDIDSLLAGADSKKIKPKYWIKNFED